MNKRSFIGVLLTATLALAGCGHESDGAGGGDPKDDLSNIELAKDFTRSFQQISQAMEDMQAPIMDAAQQFSTDVEPVEEDVVQASVVSLAVALELAGSLIEDAIIEDASTGEVSAIDYSQIAVSTTFSSLISSVCGGECDETFGITSEGSVTRAANILSVANVEFSTELFDVSYDEQGNVSASVSRGTHTSTLSFNIELPAADLSGDNTLAFAISGLSLKATNTNSVFELAMAELGGSAQFGHASTMTLDQLLVSQDFNPTSSQLQLADVALTLGAAQFTGALSFALPVMLDTAFEVSMSISGKLTNSLGEHFLAGFTLSMDGTTDASDSGFDQDASVTMDLELTFQSQNAGDLSILLSGLGSSDITETNSTNQSSYSEMLMLGGDITLTAGDSSLLLSFVADNEDSGSDSEENNTAEFKMIDANYTNREVYILFGYDYGYASGTETESQTAGVYVGSTQYGEIVFDEFNDTLSMDFSDGEKIQLLANE